MTSIPMTDILTIIIVSQNHLGTMYTGDRKNDQSSFTASAAY